MSNLYGSIDLTILGNIVRQHPSLVREVTFKDGSNHKFLQIDVSERRQPSEKGNTHYIKATCKKDQQMQGVNYFIADLKPSTYGNQPQQAAPLPEKVPVVQAPVFTQQDANTEVTDDGLPF